MSSSLPNASVVRARGQRAAIFSPEPAQVRTNGVHDEGALDAHGGAVARVDPLDFAGDEAVRDARDAGAAVPLDGRTEQAELAHLGQDGAVKVCGAGSVSIVLVGGDRRGRAGLTLVAVRFSDARCEVLLAVRVRHVQDGLFLLGKERADFEGVIPFVWSERRCLCACREAGRVSSSLSAESGGVRGRRRRRGRRTRERRGRLGLGGDGAGVHRAGDGTASETLDRQAERHGYCVLDYVRSRSERVRETTAGRAQFPPAGSRSHAQSNSGNAGPVPAPQDADVSGYPGDQVAGHSTLVCTRRGAQEVSAWLVINYKTVPSPHPNARRERTAGAGELSS